MAEQSYKQSSNNLDLTTVPNDDHEQLAKAIESFYKSDSTVKSQLAYHWERNHLMLDGKQWLVYERTGETGGIWKPLKVSKENEYIPRPVTNLMYDAYQTLKGYLLKNKPRISVRPNTQTHADKSAAKLANLVAEANYERLKEDQNYEYSAAVLVTYGTVFKKSYWDTSAVGGMVKIPRMVDAPTTDPATGEVIGSNQVPAVDPATGEELFDELPLGDVNTDVVEPYRIAIDPLANDLHKARWVMEYSIQPLDWIKSTYSRQEEGFTGKAEELKEETQLSNSMRRFYNLKNSSGVSGTMQSMDGTGSSDTMVDNSAVLKEYYEKPSEQNPKGRLVVVANGVTLYSGASPYHGPDLGDWHPYSECRWEIVPGRFWGKSPLDDGAEIQKQVNSIDAAIILTRKTMAIPQKLIPIGKGIEPGRWTGRPGQEIFYRDDGSGAVPSTIPAAGVDQTVFVEREQRVEDFKQITGAIDILKGDRPPGVTAASALSMLYEVGTGKLFPILDRWKKFVESDQKKQLKLVSSHYREPREDFIRLLQSRNKELSVEEISRFIGEDLHDNCNVIIEAGSHIPKLQAAEQALLLEVANTGALNLELPANRTEFVHRLGIVGFDNDIGPDMKRAEWENDLLDNLVQTPDNIPVVLMVDNHAVHKECHAKRMKEPSFMQLSPQIQQAYMQHYMEHENMAAQEEQMKMLQAAMSGQQPEPSQDQAALTPQPIEGAGGGVGQKMQNSLMSDAIVPGTPNK